MDTKKFSTRDIAEFKRTAKNVWPLEAKRLKIAEKVAELNAELEHIEKSITLKEGYVMAETGYHVMDLINRVVTTTPLTNEDGSPKLDEKGRQVTLTVTDFVLKYPDTVVPPTIENTTGSDFDIDSDAKVEELESLAAEAAFNPIENL